MHCNHVSPQSIRDGLKIGNEQLAKMLLISVRKLTMEHCLFDKIHQTGQLMRATRLSIEMQRP